MNDEGLRRLGFGGVGVSVLFGGGLKNQGGADGIGGCGVGGG